MLACAFASPQQVGAQQVLVMAPYPAVDEIVKAAIPAWKQLHPTVDIKVVSREFADHHTAMTTAQSPSGCDHGPSHPQGHPKKLR